MDNKENKPETEVKAAKPAAPEAREPKAAPEGGEAKKQSTVSVVIDRGAAKRRGIDPEKVLAEMKSYSYPKDKDKITNLLFYIESGMIPVNSGNLRVIIDNLAKWAREARELKSVGFLQQIASCARKMDALGESELDIFFSLWKIVPEIANSIGDCKKIITNVIDSHTDDYDIVISSLLPFFKTGENFQHLPEFFKTVFPEEDNHNNRDLVSSAWNRILCDKDINDILTRFRYFSTKTGKEFARHIDKHSPGREMPKALVAYRKAAKAGRIKMLGVSAAVLVVGIIAAIVAVVMSGKAIDYSSVAIDYPTEVTLKWGEDLNLDGKTITYKSNNGETFTVALTEAKVNNFNKNKVGQQIVTLEYLGKKHTVTVTVEPIKLSTPEIKLQGGAIVWDPVVSGEGKVEYIVALTDTNGNPISVSDDNKADASFTLPESLGLGAYQVTVTAKSLVSEYVDSEASGAFKFDKQAGVTNVKFENGSIVWDKNELASRYEIKLNGATLMANDNSFSNPTFKEGDNEVTVTIVYDGNTVFKTTTVKIYKIPAPKVSIVDGKLSAENPATKFYLDGVEISPDQLDSLTATPREYAVSAKIFATSDKEVDSDPFETKIERLPKPILSVSNNALVVQTGYKVNYTITGGKYDADVFDGNIIDIAEAGIYKVTAVFTGKDGVSLALPSVVSNEVTFEKLPVPTISKDGQGGITIIDGSANVELYVNGEKFDGDIDSLPSGYHTITARNIGDGVSTISSAQSNPEKVEKVNTTVNAKKISSRINFSVSTDLDKTKYAVTIKVDIKYYSGDELVYTTTGKTVEEGKTFSELSVHNEKEVDRVEITVTISYTGFNNVTYTETKVV